MAFGSVSLLLFLLAYSCNDDNDHTVTVMAFIPRLLRALACYPSQVNGPFLPLLVVITYLLVFSGTQSVSAFLFVTLVMTQNMGTS